jgi:N-acetylmuramoyl-L-alanine amidase CwlA
MTYPIKAELIPGLPKIPFRNGVYEGIVNHSTATPNACAENEHDFEASNNNWQSAFVHFFVDDTSIIQIADTDYIGWGAGPVANPRYLHIELCEFDDSARFQEAYKRYVWLTAKLLRDKNLGVIDGVSLVSHAWVAKNLGGTTHQDPISFLESHGISWAQHVANVQAEYNASGTFRIKVLASELWYYDKPDWNAKKAIVKAGEVFTVVETLMVLGSKMYKLKSGTYITADPKYVQVI